MPTEAVLFDWQFNTEHPEVARVRHQHAMEIAQTDPAESQRLLRSALEILVQCSQVCGEMHPRLFEVTKEFRRTLERSGLSPEQAEQEADTVIAAAKTAIGAP